MYIKAIGAVLIVCCCGGYGMLLASAHRKEVSQLHQLARVLDIMQSELAYRLTPVPQLCQIAARDLPAVLATVFETVADELEGKDCPEVADAFDIALREQKELTPAVRMILKNLGHTLGRFDLQGQLQGFSQCAQECTHKLKELETNQQQRLRSYQTLGFCAGAALAIILF